MFSLLQCPYCKNSFDFIRIEQQHVAARTFGVLNCSCFRYPVVDGIPIFSKQPTAVRSHVSGYSFITGPAPDILVTLILQGKGLKALLSLIAFPWCPPAFKKIRFLKNISQRNPLRAITVWLRKLILWHWVADLANSLTAEDWFSLFYKKSLIYGDLFSYFFFRFGQPRHLAALSLMTIFPQSQKPILDLACGFAHLSHYLTECEKAHQVVALDRNFFQLWVAKYWIAPKAHYVCGDADSPMPFKDATLSGVLCSDAFHYFDNKMECLNEMRRCAPKGTMILTRVGNKLVQPNEGKELTTEGYLELVNDAECRVLGETQLVDSYLQGIGPALLSAAPPKSLKNEKWLSIVLSNDRSILANHGKFGTLPHSVGRLGLNPIYRLRSGNNGSMNLSFQFPSAWFAFENEMMRMYHRPTISIQKEILHCIRNNIRSKDVDELIARFVVLGMPERYARSQRWFAVKF